MATVFLCLIGVLAPILELLELTNDWRVSQGESVLAIEADSQAAANAWTLTMIDTDIFEHAEDLSAGIEPGWLLLGENLGRSVPQQDTIASLFEALTRSPSHNQNLLQPNWTGIGIGITTDTSGMAWLTMRFISRAHLSAPALGEHSRLRE